MIIVIGTIRAPVQNLEALRAPMAAIVSASRAEEGCVEYSYGADMLDRGLIHVIEVWRDRACLDRHLTQPHSDVWRSERAALGVGERRLFMYEAGEPREI